MSDFAASVSAFGRVVELMSLDVGADIEARAIETMTEAFWAPLGGIIDNGEGVHSVGFEGRSEVLVELAAIGSFGQLHLLCLPLNDDRSRSFLIGRPNVAFDSDETRAIMAILQLVESSLHAAQHADQALACLPASGGVSVVVDDFGTGYSSSYLRKLNIDGLKIDRSFVVGAQDGAKGRAVLAAVIALADDLNLESTAGGIETEEEAELLTSMGCDRLQGNLFGRPVPRGACADERPQASVLARPNAVVGPAKQGRPVWRLGASR